MVSLLIILIMILFFLDTSSSATLSVWKKKPTKNARCKWRKTEKRSEIGVKQCRTCICWDCTARLMFAAFFLEIFV